MHRDPLDDLDRPGLLAIVVAARSDPRLHGQARRAWSRLVAVEHRRVRRLVALFRFPGHPDVRIPADQVDDVAQEVFARLLGMLDGFRGASPQELSAAVATATRFTCMDWCRRRLTRDMLAGASIDDRSERGPSARLDEQLARRAAAHHRDRVGAREELDLIAGALDRLPSNDQREVVRLTALGYSSHEIAERLGLSRVNVNQLRARALRRLREALDA